jgi:diadenosine tetraphosphatase ApaH/serine/threonine PP2A family protein phosphatase
MTKRTIIIGDLHGCYTEACDLLEACEVTQDDRIIFCGDLVDRGPMPRECVELAMKHESVLGNHEDTHLRYRHKKTDKSQLPAHHVYTIEHLNDEHWHYIESLPLKIYLPEYNSVVIHSGCWPDIPVNKQDKYHLLHLQCCGEHKKSSWPSKSPQGTFWSNFWKGPERIIFGHTGLNKPLHTEFVVGIDTGCVFGRELTALILPDDKFVQVKASKKHYERNNHPELGKTKWDKLIPIHGDVCTYS